MERTKNVTRNLFWGLINRVVLILLPFIVRTVILYRLGTEYLGLSSLFTSILSVLNLTELGFGGALVYSMYKPLADENIGKVNALLNLYRKCYQSIGIIILIIGLLLTPFLKLLIHGTYPSDINLYLVYYIYLTNTVLSYFLFAYKKSLLLANQRADIDSNINAVVSIVQNCLQILFLLGFKNYYIYAIFLPICMLLNNLWISYVVNKKFSSYKCEGALPPDELKEIFKNVKGLIFHKIGGVVLLSVDNIIVSSFLGLNFLAIYNNYYYIITALTGILVIVTNSMQASVGNSIVEESVEKNYFDFNKFNFIYVWITVWFSICLLCLYQPFMYIWTGSGLMLPFATVILFVLYFFVNKWCDMMYVYQEACGLWYENRFVPLCAAVLNLILNITLVQIIGLPGILVSTIVSVLLIYNLGYAYVLFKHYFKNLYLMKHYFLIQLKYVVFALPSVVVTYFLCSRIQQGTIMTLLICGIISLIFPNVIMIIIYRKNIYFIETKKTILFYLLKRESR